MFDELKPCPFCGGKIQIDEYRQTSYEVEVECHCTGCDRHFEYERNFICLSLERVPANSSFTDAWNRRVDNG